MDSILKLINETAKSGIGQAIIAFGAWTYVLILILVTIYYVFSCMVKYITSKKN